MFTPLRAAPAARQQGRTSMRLVSLLGAVALGLAVAYPASAQLLDRKALSLAEVKKIADAAEAEAVKNKWNVAIAIVDDAGNLLYFRKLDGTQVGSVNIAIGKAKTSAILRRPTLALEEAVKGGRNVLLALDGLTPLEGGVPIKTGDQVIGAIGVSGVTSQQDAQIAMAGANLVK
jgi:glc operon protein GlcG